MGLAVAVQPAPSGALGAVKTLDAAARTARLRREYVFDPVHGHHRRDRAGLLLHTRRRSTWRQTLLAWLRDHLHPAIPRWYYGLVLGHDLHVSTWAELYVQHYHATERDPFTGRLGWLENVGLVSRGKVTTAFRDFEIDNLVTDSTTYGDYKYHEVGTDATAESNAHTALIVSSGIARATGTQVEAAADQYQSVATVTADDTETWQEHGIFNNSSGATLMDRSLIVPTVSVVPSDQVTFTYTITKNAES